MASTLASLRSTRRTRHTLTIHRQGRAVVSSFDDDDDGNEGTVVVGGAAGGEDVDWDDIQEDEE